jgi:integrase/recombinase XerD
MLTNRIAHIRYQIETKPTGPAAALGLFQAQSASAEGANRMLQKWLGHAQLSTTATYANAIGAEEQSIAARMWGSQ